MSRELEFDGWWEGVAVYTCDCCHKTTAKFRFDSEVIDSKKHRAEMRKQGWHFDRVNGKWVETCCEQCRNKYIRNNTF